MRAAWLVLELVDGNGRVWRAGGRLSLAVAAAAGRWAAEPTMRPPANAGRNQSIIARVFR
jgi:hypothetical protein